MEDTPLRIEEIVPTIERVKNTIVSMESNLNKMKGELNQKEAALKDREEKLNRANLERQQLEFDYIGLETEFKKVSELFSELSGQQESSVSIKELLSIYIALLEKVFAGKHVPPPSGQSHDLEGAPRGQRSLRPAVRRAGIAAGRLARPGDR